MTPRGRLPFRITLLLALVLIMTALSAVRMVTALAWRSTLDLYTAPALVVYAAVSGAIWTLAGLFLLWSIRRRGQHTRAIFLGLAGAYAAWAWIDRLFIQTELRASWPFDLLLTLILLAFVATTVLDPRNRLYFQKRDL